MALILKIEEVPRQGTCGYREMKVPLPARAVQRCHDMLYVIIGTGYVRWDPVLTSQMDLLLACVGYG